MNNYSVLERVLHRLALSSQFMREVMFEFEESLFFREGDVLEDDHIFVAGLARSGTTILLNAIYQSNQFASLSYGNMPFVLAPNFWAMISPTKKHRPAQERAHGDGIKVTTDSPEAFEEVFWKTFGRGPESTEEKFRKYIVLVLKSSNRTRYLSKNNQNIRRLRDINKYFPTSKILIPFRDPLQQANSLFSQHQKFIHKQREDEFVRNYMNWIGHSEFGLDYQPIITANLEFPDEQEFNHWLEQWYLTYESVVNLPMQQNAFNLVCYESLCRSAGVWRSIRKLLDIELSANFAFRESRQDILPSFDRNLRDKCFDLYKSLTRLSLGE